MLNSIKSWVLGAGKIDPLTETTRETCAMPQGEAGGVRGNESEDWSVGRWVGRSVFCFDQIAFGDRAKESNHTLCHEIYVLVPLMNSYIATLLHNYVIASLHYHIITLLFSSNYPNFICFYIFAMFDREFDHPIMWLHEFICISLHCHALYLSYQCIITSYDFAKPHRFLQYDLFTLLHSSIITLSHRSLGIKIWWATSQHD